MTGNFFNNLVAFIKNKEGGLSNNPNDPAAKNPSPTPQNYHTNKGITYKTFQDSAATFNYNPSLSNFLAMPDEIWKPIFINKYYNKAKLTNNEVLNGLFAYWYWQGWNARYLPIKDVTTVINSNLSNKDMDTVFLDLEETVDRKSTRLNSSHVALSRMPSSA